MQALKTSAAVLDRDDDGISLLIYNFIKIFYAEWRQS